VDREIQTDAPVLSSDLKDVELKLKETIGIPKSERTCWAH